MAASGPGRIPSAEALRPTPPPALTSPVWRAIMRRCAGWAAGKHPRTRFQTLVARYRQAFDVTPSMRLAADAPGRTPVRNARMFAIYQMAFDDRRLLRWRVQRL